MELIARWLRRLPLPLRWSLVSAAVTAMVGAVVDLVLGLRAYPPTAWFAVIEVADTEIKAVDERESSWETATLGAPVHV